MEEELLVIRPLEFNKAAVLLPGTGAVVCAHVQPMPPFVHFATADHPIRARAVLGPYDSAAGAFMGCTLASLETQAAPSTTRFQRVLPVD